MERLMQGRTTIVVAHRLSTVAPRRSHRRGRPRRPGRAGHPRRAGRPPRRSLRRARRRLGLQPAHPLTPPSSAARPRARSSPSGCIRKHGREVPESGAGRACFGPERSWRVAVTHPGGTVPPMNDADRQLAALAAIQRQVFTRRQALDAGLTHQAVGRRIRSGLFVTVGPHTLCFAGSTLDWRGWLQAGVLDLGVGALVSGRSAAALHGLDGFPEGPVELLVPTERRRAGVAGYVSSSPSIGPSDRCVVEGLPVTSGTRTVLELLGRVSERGAGQRDRQRHPARLDRAGRARAPAGQAGPPRSLRGGGVRPCDAVGRRPELARARVPPPHGRGGHPAAVGPARVPQRWSPRGAGGLRLRTRSARGRGRRPARLPERRRPPSSGAPPERAPAARPDDLLLHDGGHRSTTPDTWSPPSGVRSRSQHEREVCTRSSGFRSSRCMLADATTGGQPGGVRPGRRGAAAAGRGGQRATKYLAGGGGR